MRILILTVLFLGGCASWYSQDRKMMALEVVQSAKSLSSACRRIASLQGISYFDRELAMIDLKEQAVEKEGTHLLVTQSDFGFWRQKYEGDIYRCP